MAALPEATIARRARLAWLAALVLLIAAPFIGLYPIFMMNALCFAIFACAFNLLLGFTGLLSFGHAAYLGAAAYFTGWLVKSAGFSPELGILAGTLGAGLIGLVVGVIAIRRQGIYFAMITLAMAQMVYFVWLQAPFTGGEDGLQGVPRGRLFGVVRWPVTSPCTSWSWRSSWPSSWASSASSILPMARCSRRSARTNHALFPWATTSIATSCWPSFSAPAWPGWPAR
jgi:ABC-type branched-subunit amino acid transport system permease subunit